MLAVVGFGVFVAADDLTVATTMLRQIIGDLDIPLPEGFDRAAWIVNGYLIAYVAVMPIAGRLGDVFGRRRVFVTALALFGIGSLLIPHATTLGPFLAGRVLTALGGGAMVPVALSAVGDVYREGERGRALGILGALETLGWVWGPLFGALLVRFLDWRWQFHLNVPLAVIGIGLAWWAMRDLGEPQPGRRLDLPGAAAMTIGLVALATGLLELGDIATASDLAGLGRSGGMPVWPLFLVGLSSLAVFAVWERRAPDPLLEPAVVGSGEVPVALVLNLLLGAVLAVAMVNAPLFVNLVVENDLRRAAVVSGWVLTALTASMALTSPVGGWLTDRTSRRLPVLTGAVIATVGLALAGLQWQVGVSAWAMSAHLVMVGGGLGLMTAPITAAVVDTVPADRRGVGAALVVVARLVGLTVGLAGLTAWALHRYGTLRSEIVLPPLTDPAYPDAAAAAQASLSATVLAETFLISAAVALLSAVVAAWLRTQRASTATPPTR